MAKLDCNRENMEKLARALESGDYSQARSRLRKPEGFCCLGVACDLYLRADNRPLGVLDEAPHWREHAYGEWIFFDGQFENGSVLPPKVKEWLGVDRDNMALLPVAKDHPLFDAGYPADSIYLDGSSGDGMNDGGKDFAAIARAIRRTYLDDGPEETKAPRTISEWEKLGGSITVDIPPSETGHTLTITENAA